MICREELMSARQPPGATTLGVLQPALPGQMPPSSGPSMPPHVYGMQWPMGVMPMGTMPYMAVYFFLSFLFLSIS